MALLVELFPATSKFLFRPTISYLIVVERLFKQLPWILNSFCAYFILFFEREVEREGLSLKDGVLQTEHFSKGSEKHLLQKEKRAQTQI